MCMNYVESCKDGLIQMILQNGLLCIQFEKDEDHSDVEEFTQDMEEDEMMMDDLKMPHDLEGVDDDDDD